MVRLARRSPTTPHPPALSKTANVATAQAHGAACVALTIDEDPEAGMAKTAGRKLEIAARMHDLFTRKWGLDERDLLFDPLTFTIATGTEADRRLGLETLETLECSECLPGADAPISTLRLKLFPQHDAPPRGALARDGGWRRTTISSFFGSSSTKREASYVVDVTTVTRELSVPAAAEPEPAPPAPPVEAAEAAALRLLVVERARHHEEEFLLREMRVQRRQQRGC